MPSEALPRISWPLSSANGASAGIAAVAESFNGPRMFAWPLYADQRVGDREVGGRSGRFQVYMRLDCDGRPHEKIRMLAGNTHAGCGSHKIDDAIAALKPVQRLRSS